MQLVRDWMTAQPVIALDTLTLPQARQLLKERNVRRLPVINDAGDLVGIITEGDINRVSDTPSKDVREYNLYYRIRDLPIREIMTRTVCTVAPTTPLAEVAQLLIDHRFGGVPVVEGTRVIGIITETDLFRQIIATQRADG
jgi:CBS domain-containing protein